MPPQHDEVRFWCCQTLVEGICAHAEELCADPGGTGAAEARRCALEWVTGEAISSVPAYVRNKAAQLWAAAVGEWYGRKPSAFAEAFPALLRAAGASERGADMLARCLVSLDEDIISHETGVSEARAGAVKDAMRASGAVVEVFGVSLRCAASCSAAGSPAGGACLDALARLVAWADIGLLANAEVGGALVHALASQDEVLRAGACACLEAATVKRMDVGAKLGVLRMLGLPQACAERLATLQAQAQGAEALEEAADVVQLAGCVACELLECHRHAAKPAMIVPDDGGDVTKGALPAAGEVAARRAWADQQLDALAPLVLRCTAAQCLGAAGRAALGFLDAYVGYVRRSAAAGEGGAQGVPSQRARDGVGLALMAISARITYPHDAWLDMAGKGSSSAVASPATGGGSAAGAPGAGANGGSDVLSDGHSATDEDLLEFDEARGEVLVTFRNLCRVAPARCAQLALELLNYALGGAEGGGVSACSLEAALALFHRLGEGMTDEALGLGGKAMPWANSGPGGQGQPQGKENDGGGPGESEVAKGLRAALALLLSREELPHGARRAIALVRLEVLVRYAALVRRDAPLMAPALRAFLGSRGMRHPSAAVAGRAGYLFCRFVKALRGSPECLLPHLEEALAAVSDLLAPAAQAAGVATPVGATVKNSPDDKLYVFEAVGNMLGLEAVPETAQASHMAAIVGLLAAGLDERGRDPTEVAAGITKLCVCAAALSKGFPKRLLAARSSVAAPLAATLAAATGAAAALPAAGGRATRVRVATLLHRLLEAVGTPVLDKVAPAMELLLAGDDAADLTSAMTLCGQLATRFRGNAAAGELVCAAMGRLVPLVVGYVTTEGGQHTHANGGVSANGGSTGGALVGEAAARNTEDSRERNELQKALIALTFSLTTASLSRALLAPTPSGAPCLFVVAPLMLSCAEGHPEMSVRKLCISAAFNLAREWLPADGPGPVAGFDAFAVDSFAAAGCLEMALRPCFPLKDAAAALALGEAAKYLLLLAARRGERLQALAATMLQARGATQGAAEVCALLAGGNGGAAALRKALTRAGEEARSQLKGC